MDEAPSATPSIDAYARFAAIRLVVGRVWYVWLGMCLRGRRAAAAAAAAAEPS